MKSRLSVSIVIPAYNEEEQIKACLDSIARQSSKVLEVIVVDNNCMDHTVRLAKAYPFVRVVREPRQGRVFARNTGFDAARGEVIGRIDADCVLPENWVEYLQGYYSQKSHNNTAWTGPGYFYNVRLPHLVSWAFALLTSHFNHLLTGHYALWGSNTALLQEHWRKVRGSVHLRNDIHEDLDLAMHLHEAGVNIDYVSAVKVKAHMRRVSTNRDQLWGYLQWWPRTLRLHGKWTWVICWVVGVLMLYLATYILVAAEWAARRFGRPPLPD